MLDLKPKWATADKPGPKVIDKTQNDDSTRVDNLAHNKSVRFTKSWRTSNGRIKKTAVRGNEPIEEAHKVRVKIDQTSNSTARVSPFHTSALSHFNLLHIIAIFRPLNSLSCSSKTRLKHNGRLPGASS